MLEFIILGIVPGTSFVITLWWALFFALIGSMALLAYIEIRKNKPATKIERSASRTQIDLSTVNIAGILNPIFHAPGRNLLLQRKNED